LIRIIVEKFGFRFAWDKAGRRGARLRSGYSECKQLVRVAIGAALAAPVAAGLRCREMTKAYLGPRSAPEEIEALLRTYKLSYQCLDNPAETAADLLVRNQLIGWYQGREEFGPRALGNRSILADPRVL